MWLLGNEPAPDDDALNRFRGRKLSEAAESLFYQLVKKLREIDEVRYEHLFIDGTKIEASANKYSFVWKRSTTKYQTRLEEKLKSFLAVLHNQYGWLTQLTAADAYKKLSELKKEPFVSGRGKRKNQLQRDIEQLAEMLARMKKYEDYQNIFGGRNSFSKTDPDATFMRMKDDHMHNAQLKPGYNVQLAVEGEYITGVDISSERSDQLTMIPLMERMEKNLGEKYGDVTHLMPEMSRRKTTHGLRIRDVSATSSRRTTSAAKPKSSKAICTCVKTYRTTPKRTNIPARTAKN